MNVTVRYFAVLRERRGVEVEEVRLQSPVTVQDLYWRIFAEEQGPMPAVLYVVDEEYVAPTTMLHDGAEVAFIPPLGGG